MTDLKITLRMKNHPVNMLTKNQTVITMNPVKSPMRMKAMKYMPMIHQMKIILWIAQDISP